jgi:ribosomal protein S18 acetylase RimI-like enzyme
LRFRSVPRESDIDVVRRLAGAVGVFSKAEQVVAVELIEARLANGRKSGYHFAFAELAGRAVGYCTWGPIPMTASSWDLYWIVVDPAHSGGGVGRALLVEAERDIARRGGAAVYVETSSRAEYARTRKFYTRAGYRRAARLTDFYAPSDDKIIYRKSVG